MQKGLDCRQVGRARDPGALQYRPGEAERPLGSFQRRFDSVQNKVTGVVVWWSVDLNGLRGIPQKTFHRQMEINGIVHVREMTRHRNQLVFSFAVEPLQDLALAKNQGGIVLTIHDENRNFRPAQPSTVKT